MAADRLPRLRPEKKSPSSRVTTTAIVQQDIPIYVDTIGQVIPPVTVNIRPQVNGKLIKAFIQQGAIVKRGISSMKLIHVPTRPSWMRPLPSCSMMRHF